MCTMMCMCTPAACEPSIEGEVVCSSFVVVIVNFAVHFGDSGYSSIYRLTKTYLFSACFPPPLYPLGMAVFSRIPAVILPVQQLSLVHSISPSHLPRL